VEDFFVESRQKGPFIITAITHYYYDTLYKR